MELTNKQITVIFKALCDENRVQIFRLLQNGEKCACNLLEAIPYIRLDCKCFPADLQKYMYPMLHFPHGYYKVSVRADEAFKNGLKFKNEHISGSFAD